MELFERKGLEKLKAAIRNKRVMTYQQVHELLPDDFDDPDQIDTVYEGLREQGVNLVDEEDLDSYEVEKEPAGEGPKEGELVAEDHVDHVGGLLALQLLLTGCALCCHQNTNASTSNPHFGQVTQ